MIHDIIEIIIWMLVMLEIMYDLALKMADHFSMTDLIRRVYVRH